MMNRTSFRYKQIATFDISMLTCSTGSLSFHVGAIGAIVAVAGALVLILLVLRIIALLFSIRKKKKLQATATSSTRATIQRYRGPITNLNYRDSMTEENIYEDMSGYEAEMEKRGSTKVDPYVKTMIATVSQESSSDRQGELYEVMDEKIKVAMPQEIPSQGQDGLYEVMGEKITATPQGNTSQGQGGLYEVMEEKITATPQGITSQGLYEAMEEQIKITTPRETQENTSQEMDEKTKLAMPQDTYENLSQGQTDLYEIMEKPRINPGQQTSETLQAAALAHFVEKIDVLENIAYGSIDMS